MCFHYGRRQGFSFSLESQYQIDKMEFGPEIGNNYFFIIYAFKLSSIFTAMYTKVSLFHSSRGTELKYFQLALP